MESDTPQVLITEVSETEICEAFFDLTHIRLLLLQLFFGLPEFLLSSG